MSILQTIKNYKIQEVAARKAVQPIRLLEGSKFFERKCLSLKSALSDPAASGIIAEFKRRSPSKGDINQNALAEDITIGYVRAGVSGLSVLTDENFFGAKKEDFAIARESNECPLLQKDFILDEYQIIEAKSIGADVILLLAQILSPSEIKRFTTFAHNLGLEVLLETHGENEILQNLEAGADLIGINNRNLNTFEVDIENSIRLAGLLPDNIIKVAESGIESAETIRVLKQSGFRGFLIGEYFMKDPDPAEKCASLIKELRHEG
jgi:indole-3-glycerol phosphate synthase